MRKLAKLAAVAMAAVMSVSMAFAAEIKAGPLSEDNPWGSGGTKEYAIPVDGIDLAKIDKVVVKFTNDGGYNQAIIGYNEDDGSENGAWTTTDKVEVNGNEGEVVLEGVDGKVKGGLQVQCWWINSTEVAEGTEGAVEAKGDDGSVSYRVPGTVTLTSIQLLDKDGNELKAATEDKKDDTPADDKKEDDKKDPAAPTGDATSVIALGAIAVLALAGVALTKKNA